MLINQFINFALNHRKKLLFLTFAFLTIISDIIPPNDNNIC